MLKLKTNNSSLKSLRSFCFV